jgi:hypothetical protein
MSPKNLSRGGFVAKNGVFGLFNAFWQICLSLKKFDLIKKFVSMKKQAKIVPKIEISPCRK